jgi:hypothetical protein
LTPDRNPSARRPSQIVQFQLNVRDVPGSIPGLTALELIVRSRVSFRAHLKFFR